MTNSEAKQAAIIKAFGEIWTKLSENLQDEALKNEGWVCGIKSNVFQHPPLRDLGIEKGWYSEYDEFDNTFWRPKSLEYLEYNNGWTRIEPDGSNLPEPEEGVHYEYCIDGKVIRTTITATTMRIRWEKDRITHYKKKEVSPCPVW